MLLGKQFLTFLDTLALIMKALQSFKTLLTILTTMLSEELIACLNGYPKTVSCTEETEYYWYTGKGKERQYDQWVGTVDRQCRKMKRVTKVLWSVQDEILDEVERTRMNSSGVKSRFKSHEGHLSLRKICVYPSLPGHFR
jgi:hypothetical protein